MKDKALFILLFVTFLFCSSREEVLSNKGKIEHCARFDNIKNTCEVYEEKNFPILSNLKCIPCNNSDYRQVWCIGNCDSSNFLETHKVYCEESGCKNGYYNLRGSCIRFPGCSNCTYDFSWNNTKHNYKCYECESDKYFLTRNGKCKRCRLPYCERCHFSEDYEDSLFLKETDIIFDFY